MFLHIGCFLICSVRLPRETIWVFRFTTMKLREDQARLQVLLKETITLLCKNGLHFKNGFIIDALIGITTDDSETFLVKLEEEVVSLNDDDIVDGTCKSKTPRKRASSGITVDTPSKRQRFEDVNSDDNDYDNDGDDGIVKNQEDDYEVKQEQTDDDGQDDQSYDASTGKSSTANRKRKSGFQQVCDNLNMFRVCFNLGYAF